MKKRKRKYDFSKITTEQLREAVNYYNSKSGNLACSGIQCNIGKICPLYHMDCDSTDVEERHELFKEELRRREMKENKMPELEAGMVIKTNKETLIMLPDEKENLLACRKSGINTSYRKRDILQIFRKTNDINYFGFFGRDIPFNPINENWDCIWQRNPNQEKIEEIEETIKQLQEQVEELKCES